LLVAVVVIVEAPKQPGVTCDSVVIQRHALPQIVVGQRWHS
jgi:hypothetical protein